MESLIASFADYLRYERQRSVHTVTNYSLDLHFFVSFVHSLDDTLTWDDVDDDLLRRWMEQMMDEGCSASTVCRRLSSVRSFYRYALSRALVSRDPSSLVRGPKKGKPLPQYLSEPAMDRLLSDDMWDDTFSSSRARTIILVFYSTGIRLSELTSLDDEDIDFSAQSLKVLGKRRKERIIPFGAELCEALKSYIACRAAAVSRHDAALFVDDKGCRLPGWKVRAIVQEHLAKVSTLRKRSPHVLRHTFATAMLNHGASLETIRALLGHANIGTTEIYTHVTIEQLQRVYACAHPRGGGAVPDDGADEKRQ